MWHFIGVIALGGCLLATIGNSAYAAPLSEEESRVLLNGTTWKMGVQRSFAPNRVRYWEWKPDGSVCGRLPGLAREEPCTDIGQWQLEGNRLCWRFDVLIEYRVACFRIERAGDREYHLINDKTNNQVYVFYVVE